MPRHDLVLAAEVKSTSLGLGLVRVRTRYSYLSCLDMVLFLQLRLDLRLFTRLRLERKGSEGSSQASQMLSGTPLTDASWGCCRENTRRYWSRCSGARSSSDVFTEGGKMYGL